MPVNLSYINSSGEEIILDDGYGGFMRELRGRSGAEAPSVKLSTIEHADGSSEVIHAMFKPRKLTFYFYAENIDLSSFEISLQLLKLKLIETGTKNEWGKIKIRKWDGNYVMINCIYTGGFDQIVRDEYRRITFSLTFQANDPLFYDLNETSYSVKRNNVTGLYMENGLFMNHGVYFKGANMEKDFTFLISCQKCYPKIVITGHAENIIIINNTTGKIIQLNSEFVLASGEKVTIYTEPLKRKVIYTNAQGWDVNITPQLSANSTLDWTLERGNNRISVILTQQQTTTSCVFYYRQGWLSV